MSALPQFVRMPHQGAIRPPGSFRVAIGHALVDACSFAEAAAAILDHARFGTEPAYVITPNAQHIVLLDDDVRLREIYQRADLVVPDGISLLFAARIFGRTLPERVTGVDLFQTLCGAAADAELKVFFLGGLPGSADLAAGRLKQHYPSLQVETYCPPFGFEKDPAELERIATLVRAAGPQILFVGLGAPKQEYWIHEHSLKLGVRVCMGIGGSFEMVSGVVKRAPNWVRSMGCEWLYRLSLEPRRLWRRYLIGNSRFLFIILRQRLNGGKIGLAGTNGR